MDRRKEGITITLSALLAWLPAAPVFWLFIQPVLIDAVSVAMADEIQEKIQDEITPLNAAFVVLIKRDIAGLRRQIAELEYKRDNNGWSANDAKKLVDLELELESSQRALQQLMP